MPEETTELTELQKVKIALEILIEDADLDKTIQLKINAVKGYLLNAGATTSTLENDLSISCIAIGVNDLLNNKSGDTKLSPAFEILARQICRG